jgi:hypothetical protein
MAKKTSVLAVGNLVVRVGDPPYDAAALARTRRVLARSGSPARNIALGDIVESGGPPMVVVGISTPGRNTDIRVTSDVVVWWRAKNGKPQIAELDTRCVRRLAHAFRRAGT